MFLFIKLSHQRGFAHQWLWQLVYETAWCIYVFIYLSFFKLCSIQFLKKKKIVVWIWGHWRSCTNCSETNRLKWSKMPTCSDWLQPERYRKMQLFYLVDLFFICIELLNGHVSVKTYLSDKCQALNSMNEQIFWKNTKRYYRQTLLNTNVWPC